MKILMVNLSLKEMEYIQSMLPDLASLAESAKEIVKEERVRRILNEEKQDKSGVNKHGSSHPEKPSG